MRADAATEQAIFAAVDAFFDHLAERRLEETLAAFVPDRDAALYGSEVGEIAVGPEALRRFFESFYARPNGPRFAVGERRASVRGDVAWFTCAASVAIGEVVAEPYRLTGVLERREGRWLWVLFNGSELRPDRG
jgi:ketosteroid isomerase-like protein